MAEPRPSLASASDSELERALRSFGREVAFPATPDLAARVRERLAEPSSPAPLMVAQRGHWRAVWLAMAAIVILGSLLALFPDARSAIADRLGLGGVQIRWVDELPTPAPSPAGDSLQLGRAVTLAEAAGDVEFPLLVPALPDFSEPATVYLLDDDPGAMVSFVYPPQADVPASSVTGVGALLTQFRGEAGRDLVEKGLRGEGSGQNTALEAVTINGNRGFWISGAQHAVFFVCYDVGECREERYRLAGNVLLWEENGVTLRLESALTKDASLAIAESVRPIE